MFKKILLKTIYIIFLLWFGGYAWFVSGLTMPIDLAVPKKSDAIVILTGGHDRITTGLQLLSSKHAPELFISGVHESVTKSDIFAMSNQNDAPKCCITLGYKAKTTRGNAEETKQWASENNIKSIILVTNRYHMGRSVLEMSSLMPNIKISPYPVNTHKYGIKDKTFWKSSFAEYNKIIFRSFALLLANKG